MSGNLNPLTAEVIASWPKPNYVNPVQRTWYNPFAAVLLTLTSVLVGLRFWLRATNRVGHFGLDDCVLIPAYLTGFVFTTTTILSNERFQADRHAWDVEPKNYRQIILLGWISEFVHIFSINCTKISVLLFYRRLTHGTFRRRWKYIILTTILFTAVSGVAFLSSLFFVCTPTHSYWDQYSLGWMAGAEKHSFRCIDTRVLNPLSGSISVFGDFYAVILPCAMTWNLQMPFCQRVALYGIFSVGLLVVGTGIARTYYLNQLGHSTDLTWTISNVNIWAQLEAQLAIMCTCAPTLRVLLRDYFNRAPSRTSIPLDNCDADRGLRRKSDLTDMHLDIVPTNPSNARIDKQLPSVRDRNKERIGDVETVKEEDQKKS